MNHFEISDLQFVNYKLFFKETTGFHKSDTEVIRTEKRPAKLDLDFGTDIILRACVQKKRGHFVILGSKLN